MAFGPDITEQLARARADLRMGVPVVFLGDAPVLVIAAETLSAQRLTDLLALGGDLPCLDETLDALIRHADNVLECKHWLVELAYSLDLPYKHMIQMIRRTRL